MSAVHEPKPVAADPTTLPYEHFTSPSWLQRELQWVRSNPKARQAKSKARLQRYEELASQEFQTRNETNEIYIPPGPRLGDVVVDESADRRDDEHRLPPGRGATGRPAATPAPRRAGRGARRRWTPSSG